MLSLLQALQRPMQQPALGSVPQRGQERMGGPVNMQAAWGVPQQQQQQVMQQQAQQAQQSQQQISPQQQQVRYPQSL